MQCITKNKKKMRIAILMKIDTCVYTGRVSYKTADQFIEYRYDDDTLEQQIMKKYPTLGQIQHCDNNIVVDTVAPYSTYLIASTMI